MSEVTNPTPEQATNIGSLAQKLIGLGIQARFTRIEEGPVVTGYYFKLGASVSVKKMLSKGEDLALALGADRAIIQRVKDEIVVFVPNENRQVIDFKEILDWYLKEPSLESMAIPIPLGVDFHGNKASLDLADMPHCLITGSTGSGKSVFEASIITSLCYRFDSNYLNLYLVDTKMVDLPLFKDLPHVKDVADNVEKFHKMFAKIMKITRTRLSMFQGTSCRNIKEYHKLGFELPYIIVMIDEFGDLMELDSGLDRKKGGEFEDTPTVKSWVKQAGQICRAAGVHLICCTQRASVRVVDGDIKANLPCRIALRLPTAIDSRTILGTSGAENLLGKGDMLIQSPGEDIIQRYHGAYVSSSDIVQLITNFEYIKPSMKG